MPAGRLTAQLVMDVCGARPYTTVRLVVSARRVGGVGGGVGGGGGAIVAMIDAPVDALIQFNIGVAAALSLRATEKLPSSEKGGSWSAPVRLAGAP